jgi:hypothetical protein
VSESHIGPGVPASRLGREVGAQAVDDTKGTQLAVDRRFVLTVVAATAVFVVLCTFAQGGLRDPCVWIATWVVFLILARNALLLVILGLLAGALREPVAADDRATRTALAAA